MKQEPTNGMEFSSGGWLNCLIKEVLFLNCIAEGGYTDIENNENLTGNILRRALDSRYRFLGLLSGRLDLIQYPQINVAFPFTPDDARELGRELFKPR